MQSRSISHTYTDPLDLIWLEAAQGLGMRVVRTDRVYASWDGTSTLSLSCPSGLDADDSLAQLIFHEICHALVAGPAGRARPDWGLDNTGQSDLVLEHACHRVQAALARGYGLREFFAVTTEWRPYWDSLPEDPLGSTDDPALFPARRAYSAASQAPYADALQNALTRTARIAEIVRTIAPQDSLWRLTRERHPSGFLRHSDSSTSCGQCAWYRRGSRGFSCLQAARVGRRNLTITSREVGCEHWEPRLTQESCKSCGACCREGFDRVELRRNDQTQKRHPQLVATDRFGPFLPRPGGRCVALSGDGSGEHYRCTVYSERPRACAEFEVGGEACLTARRRAGLTG